MARSQLHSKEKIQKGTTLCVVRRGVSSLQRSARGSRPSCLPEACGGQEVGRGMERPQGICVQDPPGERFPAGPGVQGTHSAASQIRLEAENDRSSANVGRQPCQTPHRHHFRPFLILFANCAPCPSHRNFFGPARLNSGGTAGEVLPPTGELPAGKRVLAGWTPGDQGPLQLIEIP